MSLLDGLKESLKNPLADNNDDMRFALESDFEFALERAIDAKLSPADIAAILNGEDDIDDAEDDIDDPDDDIDQDYIDSLEECNKVTEATLESLMTIADELNADDDVNDIDLAIDPEDEDEIISEESLIKMLDTDTDVEITEEELVNMIESMTEDEPVKKVADTGDASIPKNSGDYSDDVDALDHDTGDELMPENIDDPTPDGDEKKIKSDIKSLVGECEALLSALESDDMDAPEDDRPAEECGSETGDASEIANVDDATPDGDENEPAGAENDPEDQDEDSAEEAHTDIPDDDENVEVKAIAENDDEDEDEDVSLESILGSLLENPM